MKSTEEEPLFTLTQEGRVVSGLENVPRTNAVFLRLVATKAIGTLAGGESTLAHSRHEAFDITRTR